MEEFYCAYAAGRSVPQALAEGMRRQMERRPHPWNWAGFACLGASGRR